MIVGYFGGGYTSTNSCGFFGNQVWRDEINKVICSLHLTAVVEATAVSDDIILEMETTKQSTE